MRDTGIRRNGLERHWREASIDPRVRALVEALNRPSLGMQTIASCEGHLRGVYPPYVYFHCPVPVAALIEKRLLLMEAREEGLHHGWRLEGGFNAGFQLCWTLKSYHLHRISIHGNLFHRAYTYGLRRRRIDSDLALLAEVICELLDQCNNVDSVPSVPDPYEEKNHQKQYYPFSLFGKLSNWIRMIAYRAGRRLRFIGNFVSAFYTWFKHLNIPHNHKVRSWLRNINIFLVVTILAAFPVRAGEVTYGHVSVARVVSVYDGDTFRADIRGWPSIVGRNMPVRIAGVDTPEIRGRCAYERDLAAQARDMAASILHSGQPVILDNIRRGKYFRIVADVWVGDIHLATALIRYNLGRPYHGGQRHGWC